SKTQLTPAIMPERLANTDPFKQIPEMIGSGPFEYEPKDYVSGSRVVFTKNEKYIPRSEPASYNSGGLRAMVDRVEWRVIPDPATAANALVAGEVDWLETPLPDLLPLLRKSAGVSVGVLDRTGYYGVLRPNWEQGPTANLGVRQAMLAAVENEAGMGLVRTRKSIPEIKAMLAKSGYNGEKIVLFHPTDQVFYNAMVGVVAQAFRQIGLNVDEIATDWGTVVERRTSHAPLDKGGWSMFPAGNPAAEYVDPLLPSGVRGNGKKAW